MKKIFLFFISFFIFSSFTYADCEEILDNTDTFSYNTRTGRIGLTANTNVKGILANTDYILYIKDAKQNFKSYFIETYNLTQTQQNNLHLYIFPDLKECNIEENYCIGQNDGVNRGLFNLTGGGNNATPYTEHIEDYHFVKGGIECLPHDEPSNNVFSQFITIYLDRISYLSDGFLSNPYLFSMVSIIFAFIILEIFLHILHIKGGYRS